MEVNWHERFLHQASWTKLIRDYLLNKVQLGINASVLEVGCGTGAVLSDVINQYSGIGYGIDINFDRVLFATRTYDNLLVVSGDAYALPFPSSSFNLVFCHYFFLWLENPLQALYEAFRVLAPGGYFAAFAEPDFDKRIDTPSQLAQLGSLQTRSLRNQGAHPGVGKEITRLLAECGFRLLDFGVPGYEQPRPGIPSWWESEWQVIKQDLAGKLPLEELERYQELDRACWLSGERVLYIPTYYALSKKPN